MAPVEQQVRSTDTVICQNIASSSGDRGFLSQNVLSQLRNLIEGLIVRAHLRRFSTREVLVDDKDDPRDEVTPCRTDRPSRRVTRGAIF